MHLPPELILFLFAMLPELEMTASIPFGQALHLSAYSAFFWSLLSVTIGTMIALKLLDSFILFLFKHYPKLHQKLDHHFKKLHSRHGNNIQRWGLVFLTLLRIAPIPGTGSYTMVVLASLLELPYWPSILAIFIGNVIWGLIVVQFTTNIIGFFHF